MIAGQRLREAQQQEKHPQHPRKKRLHLSRQKCRYDLLRLRIGGYEDRVQSALWAEFYKICRCPKQAGETPKKGEKMATLFERDQSGKYESWEEIVANVEAEQTVLFHDSKGMKRWM